MWICVYAILYIQYLFHSIINMEVLHAYSRTLGATHTTTNEAAHIYSTYTSPYHSLENSATTYCTYAHALPFAQDILTHGACTHARTHSHTQMCMECKHS